MSEIALENNKLEQARRDLERWYQPTTNSEQREMALQSLSVLYDALKVLALFEQGKLIELPCKYGDTVYEVVYKHKCILCKNNQVGKCLIDGNRDAICAESKWGIRELAFSPDLFSLYTNKLVCDIYLTEKEAWDFIAQCKNKPAVGGRKEVE